MIHHVFANRSNIGDWLSAKGIQSLLGIEVKEYLCDEPFVEETAAALSRLTPSDLIVIGGGGLFMDYFTPFWESFRPIAARVPFCIWGAGACDLKREPSLAAPSLMKEIVRQSRLCAVRDELTKNYLSEALTLPPVGCPSLSVVKPPPAPGFGLLHVDNYSTAGAEIYDAMDRLCREYAERTGRVYRQANNRIEPGREKELDHMLLRYHKSDLVVSSALHGCIFAVGMGLKLAAVSGDRKIDSFMRAAGLSDWVLDIDEIDRLPALLEKLPSQAPARDFVEKTRLDNRRIAGRIREEIYRPLRDGNSQSIRKGSLS